MHIDNFNFSLGFKLLENLRLCPGVRHLYVAPTQFRGKRGKYWLDDLDEDHFKELRSINLLVEIQSLRSVTIVAGPYVSVAGNHFELDSGDIRRFRKNLAALNHVVTTRLDNSRANEYHKRPNDTASYEQTDSVRGRKRIKSS